MGKIPASKRENSNTVNMTNKTFSKMDTPAGVIRLFNPIHAKFL